MPGNQTVGLKVCNDSGLVRSGKIKEKKVNRRTMAGVGVQWRKKIPVTQ